MHALCRAPCLRRSYATLVESSSSHGYKLAALDSGQATSSLSLVFKAGTRYEPEAKPGLSNVWRNFAFKNTDKRSALGTVRESELYGGVLSSTLTRENVIITAEFLKGDEDFFAPLLSSLRSTLFTTHELNESALPLASSITTSLSPQAHALELAHAVAFRKGLGKSLFSSPAHNGVTSEDLKSFGQTAWSAGNVGIVATGMNASTLESLVSKHFDALPSSSSPSSSSSASKSGYFGGSSIAPTPSEQKVIFVGYALPSPPSSTPELQILHALLQTQPNVKWSTGYSPLIQSGGGHVEVQSILLPYSDASLFGLLISSPSSEELHKAATHAVATLKALSSSSGVKKEDLTKAVAKAKFMAASVGIRGMGSWALPGYRSSLSPPKLLRRT